MLNYIKMIRPLNLVLALISVGISVHLLGIPFNDPRVFYPILTVGLFLSSANILNDIFDIKTDMLNRPGKPLVSGSIVVKNAGIFGVIFFTAGVISTCQIQAVGQNIVILIILPILLLYTPVFKGIPILGNVMIGCTLGLVFLFTEAAITNQISRLWFPALLAFHLTFNRELIKDIEDLDGDKNAGIVTFPVWKGTACTIYLFLISSALLMGWPIYIINSGLAGKTSLIVFIFGFLPVFTMPVLYLMWKKHQANFRLISMMLKIAIIAGLVVIYSIPY